MNSRRMQVSAKRDGIRVMLDASIFVEPGYLMKHELDEMKKVVADRLMLFMTNEVPHLKVHLSDIKVHR
jgi:hypothetical protein